MSELDRRGDSAAQALVSEVTGDEIEAALAGLHAGGAGHNPERSRWPLLALVAAATIVLVGGLVVIRNRDADEAETPLATPPATAPTTTPATTTPASAPASVAPTSPGTIPSSSAAPPSTEPATTAPPTSEPTTSEPTTTVPTASDVPPLADQADFGGANTVAYACDGEIIVAGTRQDGSPVLWHWSDGIGAWSATDLPGDNSFVPIAFVDSQVGYGFVDGYLQTTGDGGATWERVDIASPAGNGVDVIDIAVGAGYVHVLAVDQDGSMTFRIYAMPIDGDAFTASPVEFPPPAGGEPVASFVFDPDSGWMAVTSRTLIGAAHFADGQWTESSDVTCVNGGVTFAASGQPGDFVRSCDSGYMGSDGSIPEGTQLDVSSDGGQTFNPVPLVQRAPSSPTFFSLLARPAVGAIVIGTQGDGGGVIANEEGHDWQPLGTPAGSSVSAVEANGDLWVAIGSLADGTQAVWVSRDGGASWSG